MTAPVVPQFAFPFTIGPDGDAVCLEQDTVDEIAQSIEILLLTPLGTRLEVMEYGVPELAFHVNLPYPDIFAAVGRWEPRAVVAFADRPDALDQLIRHLTATVGQTRGV